MTPLCCVESRQSAEGPAGAPLRVMRTSQGQTEGELRAAVTQTDGRTDSGAARAQDAAGRGPVGAAVTHLRPTHPV